MPHYYDLLPDSEILECGHPRYVERELTNAEKKRALGKILEIKNHLSSMKVPEKKGDNLLLCNWNLKEFGQSQKHPEFLLLHCRNIACFRSCRHSGGSTVYSGITYPA